MELAEPPEQPAIPVFKPDLSEDAEIPLGSATTRVG